MRGERSKKFTDEMGPHPVYQSKERAECKNEEITSLSWSRTPQCSLDKLEEVDGVRKLCLERQSNSPVRIEKQRLEIIRLFRLDT